MEKIWSIFHRCWVKMKMEQYEMEKNVSLQSFNLWNYYFDWKWLRLNTLLLIFFCKHNKCKISNRTSCSEHAVNVTNICMVIKRRRLICDFENKGKTLWTVEYCECVHKCREGGGTGVWVNNILSRKGGF